MRIDRFLPARLGCRGGAAMRRRLRVEVWRVRWSGRGGAGTQWRHSIRAGEHRRPTAREQMAR